jgi:hypothetical protein
VIPARPGRRVLLGTAAAAIALLLGAPRGAVAQTASPNLYTGSHVTTPTSTSSENPSITAEWIRRYNNGESFVVKTWFTTPGGLPGGCPGAGEEQLTTATGQGQKANSTISAATAHAPCNGVYSFRLLGTLTNPILGSDGGYAMNGQITVAAPAPEVSKLNAEVVSGSVHLSWAAVPDPPPDFLGYRVERLDSDGGYSPLAEQLDPDQRSFTDTAPPGEGGDVVYRVLSRRAGPNGGEILAESGDRASVPLPASTTTTPPATDGGTTDSTTTTVAGGGTGGGTGGGGAGGGTGGGANGGTGGSTTGGSTGPLDRGRTGAGTSAPRLGNSSQANFDQLTTEVDPGYKDTLDYGGGEEDGLAGEGSSQDGLSSAFYEEGTGKGMAVPVATGFVLATWAFHLRFLARAAKPQRAPARRGRHAI